MNKLAENATSVPVCIGIIMDGNRRWAKSNGVPKLEGHREGYKKLQELWHWVRKARIPHVVTYAFSMENWQRPEEEVGYLMKLFHSILENETKKIIEKRVRVRFIGDRSRFSEDTQRLMKKMEEETAISYDITLHLAMSYGGRAEIVAAANAAAKSGVVTEESLTQNLWAAGMPEPDIIIRTGGEKRLSGFLTWQSVYSELFFSDTLWPDFTKEEFEQCLAEYSTRKRNFGV